MALTRTKPVHLVDESGKDHEGVIVVVIVLVIFFLVVFVVDRPLVAPGQWLAGRGPRLRDRVGVPNRGPGTLLCMVATTRRVPES